MIEILLWGRYKSEFFLYLRIQVKSTRYKKNIIYYGLSTISYTYFFLINVK